MVTVELSKSYGLFIGGKFVEPLSGETTEILDPSSNEPITNVAKATAEDVRVAVESARGAFESPDWRGIDPSKRGRLLYQVGQAIRDHFEDLAHLESLNVGKPIREAKGDVAYVYKLFEYYAGLADKIEGSTIPVPGARLDYTLRQPLGVTAHIAPWNYPLTLSMRGVAPALAAGNTAVLKPAALTPLTALRLAELAVHAGLPAGALNVVPGSGGVAGNALVNHPDVRSLTFTGSLETGRQIMKAAADKVMPVTLELGGKNPNIVLPDADLDRAVKGVLFGITQNAGQMCWAGSRLLVHESIHDGFLQKLAERMGKTRLGPGLDDQTQMGPLVSREQEESVLRYVHRGVEEGAKLVVGGKKVSEGGLAKGNFVQPTLFDAVTTDMVVGREEIFGPVLTASTFSTVDDLVTAANDSMYGLYAGIWTNDLRKAHTVAARLEAGMVSINEYPVTFPQTPFVGWKMSGIGQEQGLEAIRHYTRVKNVNVNLE